MSNDNLEGYQLLHSYESIGGEFFGMKIFVNTSARKLDDEDAWGDAAKAIEDLQRAIMTRTAKLDPKGPALRKRYRDEIAGIYLSAGVTAIFMEELLNGYCSAPCCLNRPWFRVTSSIGHVRIGWRKRVISIDWTDSVVKKTGNELFPSEDVTRLDRGIHAWGTEKAIEYIRRLHGVQ